ncbi:HK97 family phage prohead protease [Plantactinospora sp. WMMB334]|uniref:HK97 family phage prohead protease n=1 Tax=Plantactinospora sp. WMMB334 TaxID=3404119 RepID=UPI003B93D238
MSRQIAFTRAFVDRAADVGDDLLRFVGATEGEKGDGIALKMDGARLERYQANPIFGYGHRYWGRDSLPIGRSERTEVDGKKRLMFDIRFDRDDAFAATVERKYRDGFLNAVSIGFSVIEWEDPEKQDYWRGGVAVDWELYELSSVPLPMDASAVVESGRAGGGLEVDAQLLDSVRDLLGRLDADAIAALRQLLDRTATTPPPGPPADPEPARTAPPPAAAGHDLDLVRRRLQLAGITI